MLYQNVAVCFVHKYARICFLVKYMYCTVFCGGQNSTGTLDTVHVSEKYQPIR